MVGQNNLIARLDEFAKYHKVPRFLILIGQKGSGKKTIAKEVLSTLVENSLFVMLEDVKVDTIREMIDNAYATVTPTMYVLPDADKMSDAAKNALLKVTEEPPNNAYFVMLLEDVTNTLPTIKSRAVILSMGVYSRDELGDYYTQNYDANVSDKLLDLCETPSEVDTMVRLGIDEFYGFVEKVVDNVATTGGANSFKIGDMIAFKDTDTSKYELSMFLKAFMCICATRLHENAQYYADGIRITSNHLQSLMTIKGINKQSCFDMWLLDIRKAWM